MCWSDCCFSRTGARTTWEYDGEHNRILMRERMSEHQWRETTYEYDGKGRQTSVRDGLGNRTTRQYEENRAYPSRLITPKGEETRYEYDRVGRRMSVENTYGTVQLGYNSRNFVTGRTDAEGYTSQWVYDRMGNLKSYYPAKRWKDRESADPPGTYRGDLINKHPTMDDAKKMGLTEIDPMKIPVHPDVNNKLHANNPHYNIKLPDGNKAAIIIRVGD